MPSNETIELLESVLSESKAFRKFSDTAQKKTLELIDNYDNAKDSGDPVAIAKAAKELKEYNNKIMKYGIPYPTKDFFGNKNPEVYDKEAAKKYGDSYKTLDKQFKMNTGSARPKNVAAHGNINARTGLLSGKYEAAMILIEALNTLLNE